MPSRNDSALSKGGRYYRTQRSRELARKRGERGRLASAAYGFVETHPEYAARWHARYDQDDHT
jgi:hypothetical protein